MTRSRPGFTMVIGRAVLCVVTGAWANTISSGFNFLAYISAYFFILTFVALWKWWGAGVIPAELMHPSDSHLGSPIPPRANSEVHIKTGNNPHD